MKVITAGIASQLYTLPLAEYGPAVFEYTGSDGQLYAAALDASSQLITTANPAQRGQYISLYANGLGPVPISRPAEPPVRLLRWPKSASPGDITVTIGGSPGHRCFCGLAPNYVGLYQLNLVVPTDVGIRRTTAGDHGEWRRVQSLTTCGQSVMMMGNYKKSTPSAKLPLA